MRIERSCCQPIVCRPRGGRFSLHPRIPPQTADLGLYSQSEVWSQGGKPTWDSGDIFTVRASHPPVLLPVFLATIHNFSLEVGAFDVLVHCDTSRFGIGTPRTRLATQVVSFRPGSAATLKFPVDPALLETGAFVGAHVTIEYPPDTNLINNRGSQTVWAYSTVQTGHSISGSFPVHNSTASVLDVRLRIQENNLSTTVAPTAFSLLPGAEQIVTVQMVVPPGAGPQERVTIVAVDAGNRLIDGLTYAVLVKN